MPKLAAKQAKAVEAEEAMQGGFEPLRPGKYIGTLEEVEAKVSNNNNPMWNVTFKDIYTLDGDKKPGKQFTTLMIPKEAKDKPTDLSDADSKKWDTAQRMSRGRMKAFFDAFGYETNTDTDEMLGERCILRLNIETIKQGEKMGQQTNRVVGLYELTDEYAEVGKGEDADGDDF